MRPDLERPFPADRPLVADVEPMEGSRSGLPQRAPDGRVGQDRDDAIIRLLRDKLKDRRPGNSQATSEDDEAEGDGEDKYEPQRLMRKICWQYDSNARKVPLLRRPYI
jgi:hypothetical protein